MIPTSRRALWLVLASLGTTLALAAWSGPLVWADSGSFAVVLFGLPAGGAVLGLVCERALPGMLAPAALGVLALASLGWALVTALGVGLVLLLPALLLLSAAVVSWQHRSTRAPTA